MKVIEHYCFTTRKKCVFSIFFPATVFSFDFLDHCDAFAADGYVQLNATGRRCDCKSLHLRLTKFSAGGFSHFAGKDRNQHLPGGYKCVFCWENSLVCKNMQKPHYDSLNHNLFPFESFCENLSSHFTMKGAKNKTWLSSYGVPKHPLLKQKSLFFPYP